MMVNQGGGSSGSKVGSVGAPVLTYATVSLCTFTILVSYVIAVSLHHEPAWLPMISDCATKAPEMYIFRFGMLVSACLLATNVLVVHAATKATYSLAKCTLISGLLAASGLALLTTVNVHEFSAVHGGRVNAPPALHYDTH